MFSRSVGKHVDSIAKGIQTFSFVPSFIVSRIEKLILERRVNFR